MSRKLSKEEVVSQFHKIHGDKYDYSKFEYIGTHAMSTIICKKHGDFQQSPIMHKKGQGCPKCIGRNKTDAERILELINIHGETYDYSKFRYNGNHNKSIFVCRIHGEFEQIYSNHKRGHGCELCTGQIKSTDEYIGIFKKIHSNRFNYSKFEYEKSYKRCTIICPDHGDFLITPNGHQQGHGCPRCVDSLGEIVIATFLSERGVVFIQEHKFPTCLYKRKLLFDFFIPEKNLIIEYHGIQHFQPIDYFGGIESLTKTQKRDRIKKRWAIINGFYFEEIHYDENIQDRLKRIFEHYTLK